MKINKNELKNMIREAMAERPIGPQHQDTPEMQKHSLGDQYQTLFTQALDGPPDVDENQALFTLGYQAENKKDPNARAALDGVFENSPEHQEAWESWYSAVRAGMQESKRLTRQRLKRIIKEVYETLK